MKKRLLVDLSSVMWTSLLAGKDEERGYLVEYEEKQVRVNSAEYGYENAVNMLLNAWRNTGIQPKDTILVYESGQTKLMRQQFLPAYKAGRGGRPDEAYEEFNRLKAMLVDAVKSVGGCALTRRGMEGDDILAFLVGKLRGVKVIMSNDGDLTRLLDENTSVWKSGNILTTNPYGPWDPRFITLYKATVGDSSDSIPGAKGFGPKAFLDVAVTFGDEGMEALEELIVTKRLNELEEDVQELKVLKKLIDHQEDVYKSYAAAKLYPELVENMRMPLEWDPGYVRERREIFDERLRPFGGVTRVVHAGNWDEAFQFFKDKLSESEWVSLDLETTSSEEADEWLKGNGGAVDPLDATIVSMGLTFGANQNFNLYFTVGHAETETEQNLTMDQLKQVLEAIPVEKRKVIHNAAGFELPVIYRNLGELEAA